MGPTWGRQDPDGPHVGHVNLAILANYIKIMVFGLAVGDLQTFIVCLAKWDISYKCIIYSYILVDIDTRF